MSHGRSQEEQSMSWALLHGNKETQVGHELRPIDSHSGILVKLCRAEQDQWEGSSSQPVLTLVAARTVLILEWAALL